MGLMRFTVVDDESTVSFVGPDRQGAGKPYGIERRLPLTTSRVVGSPEPPPPFKVVRAFPNLKFEHPLLMARAPGGARHQ